MIIITRLRLVNILQFCHVMKFDIIMIFRIRFNVKQFNNLGGVESKKHKLNRMLYAVL